MSGRLSALDAADSAAGLPWLLRAATGPSKAVPPDEGHAAEKSPSQRLHQTMPAALAAKHARGAFWRTPPTREDALGNSAYARGGFDARRDQQHAPDLQLCARGVRGTADSSAESDADCVTDTEDSDFRPSGGSEVSEILPHDVGDDSDFPSGSSSSSTAARPRTSLEGQRGSRRKPHKPPKPPTRRSKHASQDSLNEGGDLSNSDLDGEEEVDAEDAKDCAAELSDASSGPEPEDSAHAQAYPGAWRRAADAPAPGHRGFRAYAEAELQANISDGRPQAKGESAPMQPHQEVVAVMLHPRSPVHRLLIDQPTGAGKTRAMIAVLNQLFDDPRPKVPIFPRAAVCRNFYEELLRWPSSYRDFFCCVSPSSASLAAGLGEGRDWRTRRHAHWPLTGLGEVALRMLCAELRDALAMNCAVTCGRFRSGFRKAFRSAYPDEPLPRAPLRALSYASAGGSHTKIGQDGQPLSALLKFGYKRGNCVYSKKIVLLDEAHNLVRTQTKYKRQLANLRKQLHAARGSIVCGFTGTPIPDDPASGWQLLKTIKGHGASADCNEGFLVSMVSKRPPLFPHVCPCGFPDAVLDAQLQSRVCVRIPLGDESLKFYDLKLQSKTPLTKLQPYCNTASHVCAFHGRRKATVLRQPVVWMPKLAAIATAVCRRREKSVILISRLGGYKAMLALLQRKAARAEPAFTVSSAEAGLAEFNASDNARGERILVLVADSGKFCEGTSFQAVRCLYLADVPGSALELQQQCGRVARMFGHQHLPPKERRVRIIMPVATFPQWVRDPLGAWALRASSHKDFSGEEVCESAREIWKSLKAVGITTLEKLKNEVDAEAELEKPSAFEGPIARLSRGSAQNLMDRLRLPHKDQTTIKALQALSSARSMDKARATLASSTADEDMLKSLSLQLATQIPALAEFRQTAIDCDLAKRKDAVGDVGSDEDAEMANTLEASFAECSSDEEIQDSDDGGDMELGAIGSAASTLKSASSSTQGLEKVKHALANGWKECLDRLMSTAKVSSVAVGDLSELRRSTPALVHALSSAAERTQCVRSRELDVHPSALLKSADSEASPADCGSDYEQEETGEDTSEESPSDASTGDDESPQRLQNRRGAAKARRLPLSSRIVASDRDALPAQSSQRKSPHTLASVAPSCAIESSRAELYHGTSANASEHAMLDVPRPCRPSRLKRMRDASRPEPSSHLTALPSQAESDGKRRVIDTAAKVEEAHGVLQGNHPRSPRRLAGSFPARELPALLRVSYARDGR